MSSPMQSPAFTSPFAFALTGDTSFAPVKPEVPTVTGQLMPIKPPQQPTSRASVSAFMLADSVYGNTLRGLQDASEQPPYKIFGR